MPAAPVLPGLADGDVMPQAAPLAPTPEEEARVLSEMGDPNYWNAGSMIAAAQKSIGVEALRKARRAEVEAEEGRWQAARTEAPSIQPNLLGLQMAEMFDPTFAKIEDPTERKKAAQEVFELYHTADAQNDALETQARAQKAREVAERWEPSEYYLPEGGVGRVLYDMIVNAPYTLKNMPLAAAATLAAGPFGAIAGSIPGAIGEGYDEATDVYWRLREKGVPHDEAYRQYQSHAKKVALGLMLSDSLQNMATFGLGKLFPNAGAVTRALGGLAFDMGGEGLEEVLEGVAANKAVGDPNDWNELGYEGLLGALSGALFGGGGMAANAIANAMAKRNAPAAAETRAAPTPADPVAEVLEEIRKEDDAKQTLPRGERAELMRWARGETGRMAEEAQFAEDGTPENPLSEADLVRYQEIRDAMKRRDYDALSAMRGEAEAAQSAVQPESSHEDAAVGLAPEAAKAAAPRKGRYTDMDEFVAAATSPGGKKIGGSIWMDLDPISDETADKIQDSTGIDVHGYGHALDGSSIVHILNRHGEGGTSLKDFPNQVPLTARDFNLLPGVIEDADVIEPGGKNRIVFKKRINGHFIVVEGTRNRFGKLVPVTARKEKAAASPSTSETLPTPSEPVGAMPPFETTSLKSGPSEPEPAPASLASTTPTLEPEGGSDWRYENRNLGSTLPPSGEDVNARGLEDGENFEGYEQQGVGPVGTAPDQAESSKAKGAKRPRTPAEIRRLGKEVEARMIAAGRDVKEAKAMGLLASEFAGRFAKRTGTQPAEALSFEMRQGKAQGAQGGGYDQSSVRQSEEYDSGDPKTWPAGPARDEALALQAWQSLEDDDEVETWPESPEKDRALELQNEIRQIDEWIENLSREEFDRRLRNDDPEFVWKNEHGVELEKELHALRRDLRKKKPKGAERRLSQLIEAEEEAAAREAQEAENARIDAEDAEEYYQIIGKRGAEALDAADEGTVRLDNLNVAREMEQAGKDAKAIRLATGWERGADGKWRHEILDGHFLENPDSALRRMIAQEEARPSSPDELDMSLLGLELYGEYKQLEQMERRGGLSTEHRARLMDLGQTIDQRRQEAHGAPGVRLGDIYSAPDVYRAYPELQNIRVVHDESFSARDVGGYYNKADNAIHINARLGGVFFERALPHELQHVIQGIEGFADGGSPERHGQAQYHRLAGEVESRNVERRLHMTDKERRERLLSDTEDVAREDQIFLKGMMEAHSRQQVDPAENIRRGQAAMEKVIAEQTDVMDAMHRDDLGSISFLWGEPGDAPYYMNGSGISHILAKRSAEGMDAEKFLMDMVEVIANGDLGDEYGRRGGRPRIDITKGPITAVLGKARNGEKVTWVVTGWDERVPPLKKPRSDTPGREQGLPGATLSETTPPVTEREQNKASTDSKPPVAQKDKGESTAPNGRTYFLPDRTSVIEFFETANKSTSFHEFGHHVFNKMVEFSGMEGVDPQLAEDVKTILEEAGVSREAFDADTDGARTTAHEFFARGFETYLSEGKAPTARLRDAFRRIRNWMIEVYNDTAKALGIKLSDEMRGVYDRLFASDGAFGDIYGAEDVKAGTNAPAQTQGTVTTRTRKGVEVERKVRDTSNDTRMMDLLNSPNVVAKRHGKFRPFFGMAKEAVEKQERMRSNWNKAVDAIYGRKGRGGLLKKDQVSLFNETLLEGDALSKVFTSEELQERGFDTNMARAYRLVRGLYDNAHRMLSAQRNKYGKEDVAYRKGYVPHFFHAWRVLEDGKIVTSFRSMNEAIKAAEKMKKEGENRNIRVAPALDDFGGRGKLDAVTLGDMQYFKLVGNIEKAFELPADEARALLEDTARMKGRSRVFKNAWERKGVTGFDTNMEYALRHYLNLSARYIAMDTLKHDGINLFERTFGRFDNDHTGLARYTKNYINDVLGVPSNVEQTLNNWIRNSWLGKYIPDWAQDRPSMVLASNIAGMTAHCKLGCLNLSSAAMNLSQLNGTQAIIGPTWTARGLAEYLHPNQMTLRLYADAGVEENITAENPSGYSKVHQARGLLADTSMMAFRLVDGMARKVTLIGAYRKALSEGKNRAAAIEYAKQVNDDVNFDYSVADAPNFIRRTGPIGTLLFQFKKFPVKMLELALPGVGKLKGWEQARFWAPMVVLSGVFGLPGFDLLKDWLKSIFGKDLELETKKLVAESSLPEPVKRTILYGALSNLGIDVGRRAGMGDFFPSELKDLTGPAAATAARVVESLPKIFDDGNFMDLIEGISPGLANPIKAVMGEMRDRRRDRVAFRYKTPGERIARATGARPIREAIENDAMRIARHEQQKRSAAEADAIDDFIRAREDSDARALDRARARLRELRITPDRIRSEMIRRRSPNGGESTAYERAMRGARTPRRIQDYRTMGNYTAMWD